MAAALDEHSTAMGDCAFVENRKGEQWKEVAILKHEDDTQRGADEAMC
jgi:hypothetical protein